MGDFLVEAGGYRRLGVDILVACPTRLHVHPSERLRVEGEEHILSDESPQTWCKGTSLHHTLGPVDTGIRLPMAIDPESVRVRSCETGETYAEGVDYFLDHSWGGMSRIASGGIGATQGVRVDYEVYLQRIDLVQVSAGGEVSLKKGDSSPIYPVVPRADEGCVPFANIYIPYRTVEVSQSNIYPYPEGEVSWRDCLRVEGQAHVAKALGKLRGGEHLSIVCWGDSVTEGCSASTPANNYVELLRARLASAYPQATISLTNAGIGGSSTDSRRDGFAEEVLAHNPDLITVEFVNDVHMPVERISGNWHEFIRRAREHNPGVEFILLTPTYMLREWMGNFDAAVAAMRGVAREAGVALGDATNIWAHLHELGIPYETLLANCINHPNDLGHEFFAATLMELLGAGGAAGESEGAIEGLA